MNLTITELYEKMHQNMGNSGWWPAESKAEIIVGAIMIQNTNWRNADKAVAGFRKQTNFDLNKIRQLTTEELQALVRPAGFYNQLNGNNLELGKLIDGPHIQPHSS